MGEKQPDEGTAVEHMNLCLISSGPAMADMESHCFPVPLTTEFLHLKFGRQLCLKSLLLVKQVKETIAGGGCKGVFFKGRNVRDARSTECGLNGFVVPQQIMKQKVTNVST